MTPIKGTLKIINVCVCVCECDPFVGFQERVGKPLETILPHVERLSKPVRRPPDNNERTYEELYKV